MKLTLSQMRGPAEAIGHIRGGGTVYKMFSKGGLAIVLSKDEQGGKILGTGPHIAIAKLVAQNNEPDLVITELNKSEDFSPELFRHLIPYWTSVTEKISGDLK